MTGKDLAMALAGAAIVGGAAGAAASLSLAPKAETAAPAVPPDVLYRLKSTEDALAKTQAALESSRKSVNELSERVASAEIRSAKQAADAAAAPLAPSRAMRIGRHLDAGSDARAAGGAPVEVEGLDDAVAVELGDALEGIRGEMGGMAGELGALRSGIDLRRLPEADRWQKAKDDLGLTWNQVEDLKKAVADRDAAMKEAMTKEQKTSASGGKVTIQRPDPAKSAHAEADYHDRLNSTLSEDQRKNWSAKGYDHAFGSNPFGGAGSTMVMSIGVSSDKQGDAPKDGAK